MFLSIGIELSSAQKPEGMDRIQHIVTTLQRSVYKYEGSLNKLVMDDKGSTMIGIWGLAPLEHEDDSTRAVLAAMHIKRQLSENEDEAENISCGFGIATGIVFSGVVGTSGSRKEFSVLGDVVNVAARMMGQSNKDAGKIYVDRTTRDESQQFLKFDYKFQFFIF